MKILLFLLSALAVALTWWRLNNCQTNRPAFGQRLKNAATGMVVGIVVYFSLMLLAMLYLMVTTAGR